MVFVEIAGSGAEAEGSSMEAERIGGIGFGELGKNGERGRGGGWDSCGNEEEKWWEEGMGGW
jgi:hypothetical protein